jgi:hypothetical protein
MDAQTRQRPFERLECEHELVWFARLFVQLDNMPVHLVDFSCSCWLLYLMLSDLTLRWTWALVGALPPDACAVLAATTPLTYPASEKISDLHPVSNLDPWNPCLVLSACLLLSFLHLRSLVVASSVGAGSRFPEESKIECAIVL